MRLFCRIPTGCFDLLDVSVSIYRYREGDLSRDVRCMSDLGIFRRLDVPRAKRSPGLA